MPAFYIYFVVLLIIVSSYAKDQNHNHAARYSDNIIERFFTNTKPAPSIPGNSRCISCLLKFYLDKTAHKSIDRENMIDSSSSEYSLPNFRSKGRYSYDQRQNKHHLGGNKEINSGSQEGALSTSRFLRAKQETSEYSEDEEVKSEEERVINDIKDFDEDSYVDDLTSDLSAYSAQSEYYDNNDDKLEDIDYSDHVANPHEEMCKTRKTWKLLNETRNQKGQLVRVLPRTHEGDLQFVYIYECVHSECEKCRGVSHNSRCRMRESYLNLYHEINGIDQYGYVIVPTHCTCELLPKNFYQEGCPRSKRNRSTGI